MFENTKKHICNLNTVFLVVFSEAIRHNLELNQILCITFALFFTVGRESTKVLNVEPESTFFFMPLTLQNTFQFS